MPQVNLKIKLISHTPSPLDLIYVAFRQCYSPKYAADMLDRNKKTKKEKESFIRKVLSSGHTSPLEHVNFTFSAQGVSRVLTHQLVRHRIASFSQQSQRYVKASDFGFIMPVSVKRNPAIKKKFLKAIEYLNKTYNEMIDLYKMEGISGENANQDARFILPQAVETKIVFTMNCRQLIHFFELRLCSRAQWEIRVMAGKMLLLAKKVLPVIFASAGPKCVRLGYCPEGRFSCGRYPAREEYLGKK